MLAHPSPLTMSHPPHTYRYIYIHHYFRCTINTHRTYYTLTTWLKYIHIYITTLPLTITVYPLIYSVHSSSTYTDTPTFTCLDIYIYTYLNIYIYIYHNVLVHASPLTLTHHPHHAIYLVYMVIPIYTYISTLYVYIYLFL